MIDECEGCVKEYFADRWVDFIEWLGKVHPEVFKEWNEKYEQKG